MMKARAFNEFGGHLGLRPLVELAHTFERVAPFHFNSYL